MDRIIDRDTDAMRGFSLATDYFCTEATYYCEDLQCSINIASSLMNSDNAVDALKELTDMLESIRTKIHVAEQLSQRISISAKKTDASNEII